jgi:putative hemolysin
MEELIIIAACLVVNALLSAYEMAFVSVSRGELRRLAKIGDLRAKRLLDLRENPERTLSVIQIGITVVGAVAAAVGGAGVSEELVPYFIKTFGLSDPMAETISVLILVLPLTYASVVIGELVPKTLALRNPSVIVLAGSRALFLVDRIFSPVVGIFEGSTKIFIDLFFYKSRKKKTTQTDPVDIDGLSPIHQQFVINMANIEKKRIQDLMIPWEQVNYVRNSDSLEDVASVVLISGHTRLPVTQGERVIGILHTKEFIALRESGETNWLSIVRPPMKVVDSDTALGILRMMQEKRVHMNVVYSKVGNLRGIVTLEDIIEEIVGDIYDEDDDGRVRKVFASRLKSRGLRR